MDTETTTRPRMRMIRSFVLRKGRVTNNRELTGQKLWAKYGIDYHAGKLIDLAAIFAINAPIVLEIGFGNGQNLLQMATQYPELNFIGIEVYASGIAQLLTDIERKAITNLRILRGDAVEILKNHIPDHALQILQIFFPDPWPKARHHKRRLIQKEFISLIAGKLVRNGVLHIATDWENYAMHVLAAMETSQEFTQLAAENFSLHTLNRATTKFEQRGIQLGHQIYDFAFRRI